MGAREAAQRQVATEPEPVPAGAQRVGRGVLGPEGDLGVGRRIEHLGPHPALDLPAVGFADPIHQPERVGPDGQLQGQVRDPAGIEAEGSPSSRRR